MTIPVIDMHCDLLSYLQDVPGADPIDPADIGCGISNLEKGHVRAQVMAIYTATAKGSSQLGLQQSLLFKALPANYRNKLSLYDKRFDAAGHIKIIAAIENASGFCEEQDSLETAFSKLEEIINHSGRVLYIGLTHHGENRFGGGNTTNIGLKKDGEALLNYLHSRRIAIDLAHTSDALAFDILDYTSKHSLDIPVMASHSNFRAVFNHPRNLPDDIAKEIIKKNGLIGINFLRAFLNHEDPGAMYDHILHGIALGASKNLCFGADYFYTASHPDQSRKPFYFPEHENASCYPSILDHFPDRISTDMIENISYRNARDFIDQL